MSRIRTTMRHHLIRHHAPQFSLAISLTLALPNFSLATYQIPERLELGDEVVELCIYPFLDEYLNEHNIEVPDSTGRSSGLTRGYIATFSLEDEMLVVKDIGLNEGFSLDGGFELILRSVIDEVLPDPKDRVLTWFSGSLFYTRLTDESIESVSHRKLSHYRIDIKDGRVLTHTLEDEEQLEDGASGYCTAGWG